MLENAEKAGDADTINATAATADNKFFLAFIGMLNPMRFVVARRTPAKVQIVLPIFALQARFRVKIRLLLVGRVTDAPRKSTHMVNIRCLGLLTS